MGFWAVSAVAFILFLPAVRFSFVHYDDYRYVVENPHLSPPFSWNTLVWAFTSCQDSLWAPLTRCSHILDGILFGRSPAGHHATNLLLHAVNTGLVYIFLARATGAGKRAWIVALLFAIHPLRVESVVWIAARKELVCSFFLLMTLIAYDGYVQRGRLSAYFLAWFLYGCALLSKPMAVTLPAVLLLLDAWPYGRLDRRRAVGCLVEKIPFFVLTVAVCAITLYAEKTAIVPADCFSLPERLAYGLVAYGHYIVKTAFPYPLYIPYMATPEFAAVWKVFGAALLLGVFSGVAIVLLRRRPYAAMGWFWFVGTLVPVIGLIPFGHHVMADRFTYFPHLGLFVVVVWGVAECMPRSGPIRRAIQGVGGLAMIAFAVVTVLQLPVWRDTGTLFRHTLQYEPDSYVAHSNLGFFLMERNRALEALPHFQRACDIKPDRIESLNDLGAAYLGVGRYPEALRVFSRVAEQRPDDAEFQVNLGVAWYMNGDREQARTCAEKALTLSPGFSKAQALLQNLNASQQ